jgi:glutaconate CoA-transferase subunit A
VSPERAKKLMSAREAVERFVKPGCMLGVGGMHMHNNPMALIRELVRQGKRIGTLVTSPSANINADLPIGAGLVDEIYCSYVGFEHLGLAPNFRVAVEQKKIRVREGDEAAVVYGLRAGMSSLPFIPLPRGLELAETAKVNPADFKVTTDPFTGDTVLCLKPIKPNVSFIHCQKADVFGNGIFEGSRFTDVDMARASDTVILQIEEIATDDYIEKNATRVAIPAMLVDAVVHAPFGCHPTSSHSYYTYDEPHLLEYLKACKEGFDAYLQKYVFGPKSHEEYIGVVGEHTLANLKEGR